MGIAVVLRTSGHEEEAGLVNRAHTSTAWRRRVACKARGLKNMVRAGKSLQADGKISRIPGRIVNWDCPVVVGTWVWGDAGRGARGEKKIGCGPSTLEVATQFGKAFDA